jgi:hypothetical protein
MTMKEATKELVHSYHFSAETAHDQVANLRWSVLASVTRVHYGATVRLCSVH